MLIKTKALVISALKYQEKSLIVKCYTQSDGLKGYFVPNAFSSKKSQQKIAYFQPLNLIEIEAHHKNKGTLEHFKEIKIAYPYSTIATSITKNAIALFLSEMLHHSLQEEEKNEALFSFLETSLIWFDTHPTSSNFHLLFLMKLSYFLGFYPDIALIQHPYFDLKNGIFTPTPEADSCSISETQLFKKLLSLTFESEQKTFAVSERQQLLDLLIRFYSLHIPNFRRPKSQEVLKEVFE